MLEPEVPDRAQSQVALDAALSPRRYASRPNAKFIAVLAAGHLVADLNIGSLPAILPLLRAAHNLSYSAVGILILVLNVTSSLVQPMFGYLADRKTRRWMLPLSLLASGLGIALTGAAVSYWMLALLVVLMGLGNAAYHPEGYKAAASVAGDRRATALSWFSLGGNAGVALGPPLIILLVTDLGLYGSLAMLLPTLVAVVPFFLMLRRLSVGAEAVRAFFFDGDALRNNAKAMALLMLVVMIRSWASLGFVTFVPFYYVDYLKGPPRMVGPLLFVFLGAGALATIIAGPLADRWGTRRLVTWGLLAAVPLGVAFLNVNGALIYVVLGVFGAVLISTFSVTVALGQQYFPRNAGLASGLIVGLAVGAGGLGVAALGWVADHYGLPAVLWISALLPLLGFFAALFLPLPEFERPRLR